MALAKLALALAISCLLASATARRLIVTQAQELETRIQAEGGLIECLNALYNLRSCTNEMVLFFLNGESYLSLDCCRGIRVITHHCWPSMLASIGYTVEEADILRGYCDASFDMPLPPPPPLGQIGSGSPAPALSPPPPPLGQSGGGSPAPAMSPGGLEGLIA